MKILAVEDDAWMANAVAETLSQQNYTVEVAADGRAGWELAMATSYDLILLDITLPKLDGISLCRKLRQEGNQTPILLLTAKDTRSDKVIGLDAGADDYLAKPFDFQELLARVRALLRRGNAALPPVLEWGKVRLDPSLCEVTCDGEALHLTRKEYGLLELFLRNPQRILSPSTIIERLWAFEDTPRESTIKSHVKALRQKLKAAGLEADCIETVYGLGYRLKALPEEDLQQNSKAGGQAAPEIANLSIDVEQKITAAVMQAQESIKAQMGDRLSILQQAAEALVRGNLDETLRHQAEREAHKLVGSLGTFGFAEASRLAEAIEDLLQSRPHKQQDADAFQQLVSSLSQEFEQTPPALVPSPRFPSPLTGELPLLLVISRNPQSVEQWLQEASQPPMRVAIELPPVIRNGNWEPELGAIGSNKPDAILLDLDSGDRKQDSLRLLSELSHQLPSVPLLAWAEQEQLSDRLEVVRHGGHGFLQKSMSAIQVMEYIIQVLQPVHPDPAEILVVDDDPVVLNSIRALLQPWGMQVTSLDTPQQFWEVLSDVCPDLLILDVEMPDINGIELCQVIRTDPHWNKLPVLFLTAHTDANTVHQIFIARADDCVSKSSMGAKLVPRVLNCLARSS